MGILKYLVDMISPAETDAAPADMSRNQACWCGSGRKYKKCHLQEDEKKLRSQAAAHCGKT